MKNFRAGLLKGLVSVLSLLFIFSLFDSLGISADFDFYATDMIAKESYRKISMDFKDADLKTVLKIFSEQAGLNFIASEAVQDRKITLFLDNVPLQEAMNKIMSANNLTYVLDPGSNIFVVKEWGKPAIETITKVYYLRYTRFKTSNLQKVIDAGPSPASSSSGGGGGAMGASTGSSGGGSPGGGSDLAESIKGVLTSNGKVIQDARTNSLIVTDVPTQFDVIDKVVSLLDVPTPQVMIEVEMLDVDKKVADQMGVDTSQHLLQVTGAATSTKFPFFNDTLARLGTATTGNTFTYGTLSASVFQATLDLLTTDTRTKVLARPRILTLSNESAQIQIATNEAIGLKTTQQSGQGSTVQTSEAERFQTGVILNVTPQVDPSTGTVTMFVQPTVAVAKTGGTFGGQTFKDPETRSSSTTLMVKDGETIVVGGLIRTDETTTIKKVPIFGDIPIVGAAFRHKDKSSEERELIVFITPHIVNHDNAVVYAKGDIPLPGNLPGGLLRREQMSAISKNEAVDKMLERWDN
jgi:type II secretory pathway component GspD/PulD (secretin)